MSRVRELREAEGRSWSQERLAYEAGVSVASVRRLERATQVRGALPTLMKIAGALGVSVEQLFEEGAA